jgi:hypothetical protein
MGMRSPQEMQQVQAAPERSTRLQGGQAPQINPQFIQTLDQAVNSREAARRKAEEAAFRFAKDSSLVEAERIRLETQGKLASKRGSDALTEAPKLREDMLRRLDQVVSKAPAQFRDRLAQEVKPSIEMKFNSNAIPYQYAQAKELKDTVQKNRLVQLRDEVVENSSDIERMNGQFVNELWSKSIEYGKSLYGEDMNADIGGGITAGEAIESLARKSGSDALAGAAIHQAVMLGSIDRAKEILTRFDLEILPADKEKAIKAIRTAESRAETGVAMNLASTLMNEYGENIAAIDQGARAASGGNVKVYNQIMGIVNSDFASKKKTKDLNRQKQMATAYKAINQGAPLAQVLNSIEDEADKLKINKYAIDASSGALTVTNRKVYDGLLNVITNEPEKIANGEVNIEAYRGDLNKDDYKVLERASMNIMNAENKENLRVTNRGVRVAKDVVANFIGQNKTKIENIADEMGIMPSEAMNLVENYAYKYADELITLNGKVGEREMRNKIFQALNDNTFKATKEEPGFFRRVGETVGLLSPEDRPETVELQQPRAGIRPEIKQELIKQYGNLTDSQLTEYAKRLKKKYPRLNVFE